MTVSSSLINESIRVALLPSASNERRRKIDTMVVAIHLITHKTQPHLIYCISAIKMPHPRQNET